MIEIGLSDALRNDLSAADYRRRATAAFKSRRMTAQPQTEPLAVHINCGIWATPCPCGGGVASARGWDFAACFDCGRTWETFTYPDPALLEWVDLVLRVRPPGNASKMPRRYYSWVPGETVADLIAENRRHGWPVPEVR